MEKKIKAALFDLDGVVFDTEPQYSIFWGSQCRRYHPEAPGLENRIKGQTLQQIFDENFSGPLTPEQPAIVERLNHFEANMDFDYVAGFKDFVEMLRRKGVKTAVVTSSNQDKMNAVYRKRPDFRQMFDQILTSEDFSESKPAPDCYLTAAARFGVEPGQCLVFEDSINGLRSGMAAEMTVVGLSTTNAPSVIAPLCHLIISDYTAIPDALLGMLE